MNYLYLAVAISFEVMATTALAQSNGLTRLWPSLITLVGYALAFSFLSLPLRVMPVGIAYAIWSGAGIVVITTIGWIWLRQTLDAPALIGMALIVAGVLIINLFSKTVTH